jgi:hypothetical protein
MSTIICRSVSRIIWDSSKTPSGRGSESGSSVNLSGTRVFTRVLVYWPSFQIRRTRYQGRGIFTAFVNEGADPASVWGPQSGNCHGSMCVAGL